jgi:hypothetical protein
VSGASALAVELEQPRQCLLFADIGGPAIGGGDRSVELAMGVVEPGRPFVVEIGWSRCVSGGSRRPSG